MFVVFIELQIDKNGSWVQSPQSDLNLKGNFMVSCGDSIIQFIEPDGLRRHLSFQKDAKISINQNILSYNPDECEEITIDEKEQSGKEKIRDILH